MGSSIWNTHNNILQESLKNIRKQAGLTQLQLAILLDHPQSYISKYESGERRLDLLEIRNIAICCESTLKDFVDIFEKNLKKRGI